MQRVEIQRKTWWSAAIRSVLMVLILSYLTKGFSEFVSLETGNEKALFLLKYGLFAMIPWLSFGYQVLFQPHYFVSWDNTQINWQLPGMKSTAQIQRSEVQGISYKPFVIKVKTASSEHEIDISSFKDKAAEQIRAGLVG